MSFDGLLNQSATVKRLDDTKDRYGNITKTYENLATDVRVRVDMTSPSEQTAEANSAAVRARIFTRYADVRNTDVIEVGGETWQVLGPPVLRQTATQAHHYEIEAQRITV